MSSVSFLATFFNKSGYVDVVLDAIHAQSGVTDAEYILVDDGSTDDTLARLERRAAALPGAEVISIPNGGPALATRAGLARVTKPFVKMVDGDDILHPDATAALIDACERWDTGVAFGDITHYRLEEARAAGGHPGFRSLADAPVLVFSAPLRQLVKTWQINPSQHVVRTELLERAGGPDPRVFIQDFSLALRLAYLSPFAAVAAPVAAAPLPFTGADRMTSNEAQILHDVSAATACFIADHADLPGKLKRVFLRRVWGRAWKWASRRGGASMVSVTFACYALAQLRLLPPTVPLFMRACRPFRETDPIRVPRP